MYSCSKIIIIKFVLLSYTEEGSLNYTLYTGLIILVVCLIGGIWLLVGLPTKSLVSQQIVGENIIHACYD